MILIRVIKRFQEFLEEFSEVHSDKLVHEIYSGDATSVISKPYRSKKVIYIKEIKEMLDDDIIKPIDLPSSIVFCRKKNEKNPYNPEAWKIYN